MNRREPSNAVAICSPPERPVSTLTGNYTALLDAILDGFLAFSLQFPGVFPVCPGTMHGWENRESHAEVYRAYTPRAASPLPSPHHSAPIPTRSAGRRRIAGLGSAVWARSSARPTPSWGTQRSTRPGSPSRRPRDHPGQRVWKPWCIARTTGT